jgi:uncharacterized membrane protein
MKNYLLIILTGLVAASTYLFRVPVPGSGGYFNFGDIAVVFCGLYLGKTRGALAGGIGSAVADLIGGFYIFIPITFLAKGLEGFIAGSLGKKNPYLLIIAGLTMIAVYFVAELLLPGMGIASALADLNFNLIQGTVGPLGGFVLYYLVNKALPSSKVE